MIGRIDLNERVGEWGLREDVVEKDYVIGWALWGIGSEPRLSEQWVFKGGTCLKKCYIETYRFSEDLDFTVLPGGPMEEIDVIPILKGIFDRIHQESGIDFQARGPVLKYRPTGQSAEGRIYYKGPRNTPGFASIKLDLTSAEKVVCPTILRQITHLYQDNLPPPATVRCYGFEEVFAEKLRAMGERSRPRDLYDIVNLFRRRIFLDHSDLIYSVYEEKCRAKGVDVFTFKMLQESPYRMELESEWENMLAHQLPTLPSFAAFWEELSNLFEWLEGVSQPDTLDSIPSKTEIDINWSVPPTAWVWGQGVPLETVRFAAANHLCVELGYQNSLRLIEPYSLRRTMAGHLLLYGVKTETGQIRSYRVDRIQSVKAVNRPFRPRFIVELTGTGDLIVAPTDSRFRRRRLGRSSRRRGH